MIKPEALAPLEAICRNCRKSTLIIGAELSMQDTEMTLMLRTELANPQSLSDRFYKAGWNIVKIDNLHGDHFQLRMVAVK